MPIVRAPVSRRTRDTLMHQVCARKLIDVADYAGVSVKTLEQLRRKPEREMSFDVAYRLAVLFNQEDMSHPRVFVDMLLNKRLRKEPVCYGTFRSYVQGEVVSLESEAKIVNLIADLKKHWQDRKAQVWKELNSVYVVKKGRKAA